MGPIGVARHLVPFLPGHPVIKLGGPQSIGPVSAAPFGSPSILTISWVYIALMGRDGSDQGHTGGHSQCQLHGEAVGKTLLRFCTGEIPDWWLMSSSWICVEFKESAGVEAMDVAKRLMDYGFHAPTVSFPVAGTLMIEPTESEVKSELDRFCEALILIRAEIQEIVDGRQPRDEQCAEECPSYGRDRDGDGVGSSL